jgi:uncharacterized phage protein (predicted DNA packaging)
MKISEVTTKDLADFLRLDEPSDIELSELERMEESAVSQILAYTGLTGQQADSHPDLTQALFVIVADMFDNRNYLVDYKSTAVNQTVQTILNLHCVNLL